MRTNLIHVLLTDACMLENTLLLASTGTGCHVVFPMVPVLLRANILFGCHQASFLQARNRHQPRNTRLTRCDRLLPHMLHHCTLAPVCMLVSHCISIMMWFHMRMAAAGIRILKKHASMQASVLSSLFSPA